MEPIFAIELDDASHHRSDRQERDEFVDKAFKAARLPLLRIPAQRAYNTRDLAARLRRYLPESEQIAKSQPEVVAVNDSTETTPPDCPQCGAPMVLRTVRKGHHQGKQFYGCSTFPKCRKMLSLK